MLDGFAREDKQNCALSWEVGFQSHNIVLYTVRRQN